MILLVHVFHVINSTSYMQFCSFSTFETKEELLLLSRAVVIQRYNAYTVLEQEVTYINDLHKNFIVLAKQSILPASKTRLLHVYHVISSNIRVTRCI